MQKRLTYLKILVSSEIPCLLWGYDAWDYACGEPGERIEQDIIVPDADLDIVSQRLQQEVFILDHNDAVFHQMAGRHLAPDSYPTSVVLEYPHPNVPHPIPKRLNIHPQSCFGFDLHKEKHRFRSVSPKHNEILIPRYHTFLEGIIHYLMNHDPRWSGGVFHLKENTLADLMLELLMNRTDDPKNVVKELTTDVAKWWMEIYFKNGCEDPKREERIEYKEKHRLQGRHLDWKSRWLEPRSMIGWLRIHNTMSDQGVTRRNVGGVALRKSSLRVTEMLASARDVQVVDSTLSMVGGDVVHNHNYYQEERPSDIIRSMLQSIPNFRAIYHDMLSKATSGTGMWLLKGDKFRLWLEPNGDIKIFWGSGIPGAGKTLLASIVIEHLEDMRRDSGGVICVCYVFFRYSDRAEMTVREVLAILVKQTFERHPDSHALIESTYTQHIREGSEPTEVQLLGLLRELVGCMACTFYVLDALDEAPTKIQLAVVKALTSLNVKLFITSRSLETVRANFPEAHTFTIVAQDSDIDLCIAKGLDESADLMNLIRCAGPSLRAEIISTIKQKCGGMFLHASLQLEALCRCINTREVLHTLHSFPSSIQDIYLQTWNRVLKHEPHHVSLAKAAFVWVLSASRPMTIEELECAVATSPYTHGFEPDRLVPGTTLMSLCCGLITVEQESRLVRLVHYTAKHTLEKLLHESFPHPHSFLASVCMTHLASCGFQSTTINSEEQFEAILKKDPLLAYASEAWAFHALAELHVEETKHRTAQFIRGSNAFPAFTSFYRTAYFDILSPLHILALYKLPVALIKATITGDPNLTTKLHQQTALIVASRSGHGDLVKRLIALPETNANLVDDDGCSALIRAARAGQEHVVKLLLAHPAIQVNMGDNVGWPALVWAAHAGQKGVVKLLLAYPGIQVNQRNNDGWSALMAAAYKGQEEVVRLLLAYPGIKVNLRDNSRWSALVWGAHAGQEGVVKLLLACPGIQVNLANNKGWSALIWAAHSGDTGVVELLLAYPGIQVNLGNNRGWSALMAAAYKGQEEVVELPLAYPGIKVNLRDKNGWSALVWAAHAGQENVVQLLLAHPGIQVNLVDDEGWSALMQAAIESVVLLLLAYPDIQVNLVDKGRSSALIRAAHAGQEGIVKLLLAVPDIQVNLRDANGWSALVWAAYGGHEGVVKLLLTHPGIQVSLVSNHASTALHLAAEGGHGAVVELLLATGSFNVDAVNKDNETAIKMAAERGHEFIVRMLLNFPAINTATRSTKDGHTAMSAAQANGHKGIVELLQEFESRKSTAVSSQRVGDLSLLTTADDEGSDFGNEEAYYDAEDGTEEGSSFGSSIPG